MGLAAMDDETFQRAWERAAYVNRNGATNVSYAERQLLDALWAIRIRLERP